MKRIYSFGFILLMVLGLTAAGQTQTSNQTSIRGQVVDSQHAVIIGAQITVKNGNNIVGQAQTGAQGTFTIPVPPGQYQVFIDFDGFDGFQQNVRVTANLAPLAVTLQLAKVQQQVNVSEDLNVVSLDPSNNLTATVLDEDFIETLPDDSDELAAYLTELAGPRAAAAGGVDFIIDGFPGGRLPPRDQILQIRINNNPFTTEFSRVGYGRIEIITKPGTGSMHGSANFNYRGDQLNARN